MASSSSVQRRFLAMIVAASLGCLVVLNGVRPIHAMVVKHGTSPGSQKMRPSKLDFHHRKASSSALQTAVLDLEAAIGVDGVVTSDIPQPYLLNFWEIQPGAYVTPETSEELEQVLECCKAKSIQCVLRSTDGHSYVGQSTVDQDGIVISMNKMKGINLTKAGGGGPNGDEYEVELGAGISLLELYTMLGVNWKVLGADAALGFNGGSCPSVGFTGLVLGGGVGIMSSRYGWAADMITSAEVVVYNKTTDSFETVIANYTHHNDLLKALKGGMGGNYGAVTRWWTKVFKAPRVVQWNLHRRGRYDNLTASFQYMRSYMDFVHDPTLDGTTPLANDSIWTNVGINGFNGLCMCNDDDCSDCYSSLEYIQTSIFDSPNNCTDDDYLNSCNIDEMSLAELNWKFAGCHDYFPGDNDVTMESSGLAMQNCWNSTKSSKLFDSSSLFLRKEITQNEQFFETIVELTRNRTYKGNLEIKTLTGAQTRYPTGCGEDECTTVQHCTAGWHVQFLMFWSNASETVEYQGWQEEARDAMFSLDGSLKTAYQNYLSRLIPREEWKTQYFPGTTNGKPTYEFLQDVKCKYNALNIFGQSRTEDYEIEVREDCFDDEVTTDGETTMDPAAPSSSPSTSPSGSFHPSSAPSDAPTDSHAPIASPSSSPDGETTMGPVIEEEEEEDEISPPISGQETAALHVSSLWLISGLAGLRLMLI